MRDQLDVLVVIRDNMDAIKRVALQYTTVEEFDDFRDQIDAVHTVLGTLVDASEIILQTTEAGFALITADDAATQRAILGLGSAALLAASDVAGAAEFQALQTAVATLTAQVTGLVNSFGTYATKAAVQSLTTRVSALEGNQALQDLINQLILDLEAGAYNTGLAARVTVLEGLVAGLGAGGPDYTAQLLTINLLLETLQQGLGTANNARAALAVRISQIESSDLAFSQFQIEVGTRLFDVETLMTGQSTTLLDLQSRTAIVEGNLTTTSAATLTLQSQVSGLNTAAEANATAISGLQTTAGTQGGLLNAASSAITDLGSRITDTETGLQAEALARTSLTTRVEQTEDGITAASNDMLALTASLTGVGNLLPGSSFELDLKAWLIFSRGSGWTVPELQRNMDYLLTPIGVNTMGITSASLPAGNLGVRTTGLYPVQARKSYIVSAYMAATNCTAQLFWRLFNEDGFEVGFGPVGQTTQGPSVNLDGCARIYKSIPIPLGVSQIQLQWWVVDATGVPKAWLFRPMMEEAVPGQLYPSPWVPGAAGLESAIATAVQEFDTRVTAAEGILTSQASQLLTLQASISTLPTVYLQPSEPTGGSYNVGDYWFDSDDGNKKYVWDGTDWNDSGIVSGTVVYAQTTAPTGGSYNIGDEWINTSDGNRLHRWDGTQWIDVSDARITAQGTAIQSLDTRVTNAENINASQSTAVTNLQNQVADPVTGLPSRASTAALDSLTTRVSAAEGTVYADSAKITDLRADVNNALTGTAANAAGVTSLTVRVSETENELDQLTRNLVTRLDQIQSDSIISPEEKPGLILDFQAILDEKAGIEAQAVLYGITTEKVAYLAAVTNLTNYLAGLNYPTLWNDVNGYTYIY